MGHRLFSLTAIAFAALIAGSNAQVLDQAIPGDPVAVTGGRVAGNLLPTGVKAYLGIPFAAPPMGDLRWKAPQAVIAWKGVRQALTLPPACMQTGIAEPISEDCLYLNLWTPPKAEAGAKLPVIVYIYGGGFSRGSASSPLVSGARLARKGVIYVAGNYRVGPFGFLAHPDLDKENPHNASGDYGLLDQLAVLQWVHANIARFGGDPGNVTVVGHSAGSVSASALQASPLAKGLFQKDMGISASGLTWEAGVFRSKEAAEHDGVMMQQALKAPDIAAMRAMSADRILAQRGGPPSVDGWYMPKDPKDIFAAGEQSDVTSFVGFTRDEGYGAFMTVQSPEEYVSAAKRMYGAGADRLLALYPADKDFKHNAQLAARDITLGTAMRRWAMGQAGPARKASYVYMTAIPHHYTPAKMPAPGSYESTAFHGSDNAFWLDTIDGYNAVMATRQWSDADHKLSDKMSDMLVAFAKTGSPDIPGITVPRYETSNERLLAIDVNGTRIVPFPGRENVGFLHGLKIAERTPGG